MTDIQYGIKIMGGREVSRPYRVWFFAEGERFLSFWRCHRPRKRAALVMWCGWFKPQLEIRHAAVLTTGAKHWHRQKAVFYVFVFVPPVFIHWTIFQSSLNYHRTTCISFPKKIGTAWWWGNPDFRVFKEMYVKSYILCARKINRFLRQLRSHPFRG